MNKVTAKTDRKNGKILDIQVDGTNSKRVLASVRDFLAKGHKFLIVTPNPEIILAAQKDQKLSEILNSADLSLPDGNGLIWASKVLGIEAITNVVRGRELFLELVGLANKKSWKIYLLGDDGVALTQKVLEQSFKKVKITSSAGPKLDNKGLPVTQVDISIQNNVVNGINEVRPKILFVGFGAPKQEKWLANNWDKLDIGGAMVVGGAFDYVNGRAKLPPVWLADTGLEWFWRLIQQPWRFFRVARAVIIFPLLVLARKYFSG